MMKITPICSNIKGKIPEIRVPADGHIYHLSSSGEVGLEKGFRVPDEVKTYSISKVRIMGEVPVFKEIVTFFDSAKRVLQRYFLTDGVNEKLYLYEYPDENTKIIKRKKFQLPENVGNDVSSGAKNILGHWEDFIEEFQRVIKFPQQEKNGKIPAKVYIKKTKLGRNSREITCTEYPMNLGYENTAKKVVSGKVKNVDKELLLSDVQVSDNLDLSLDDKFMKYRLVGVNTNEGIVALTKYYLRQKGIAGLKLSIEPSSWLVDEGDLGYFSLNSRAIRYSKILRTQPSILSVKTAAHEVEHAYEYSLIGRLGKGCSSYETDALYTLDFLPLKDIEEALRYVDARDNYPRNLAVNELRNNPLYKYNYLEYKARLAGDAAAEEFCKNSNNYNFFKNFS